MPAKMTDYRACMIFEGEWDEEAGEPASEELFLEAAQHLIDTGLAWRLQGVYGRTCSRLIEAGLCTTP